MSETIQDEAIIIGLRPHGESSAIISLLSQSHGLLKGYVKAARTQKNASIYQKGNLVTFEHIRKSQDHLGYIKAEPLYCLWALLSEDRLSFAAFNAISDLLYDILQQNIAEDMIYQHFTALIHILTQNNNYETGRHICYFLLIFLSETGFAPDLKRCAATGSSDNLAYLSPKTGRAISKEAAKGYESKLLCLPEFINNSHADATIKDLEDGIKLCGFLLEKFLFHPKDKALPASFHDFYKIIQNTEKL